MSINNSCNSFLILLMHMKAGGNNMDFLNRYAMIRAQCAVQQICCAVVYLEDVAGCAAADKSKGLERLVINHVAKLFTQGSFFYARTLRK